MASEPVVICEDNGDKLELGPNPNGATYMMLAWNGSPLVEDCAIGIPKAALASLALALLPHLTGDELRRVAEAMPRVAGEWTGYGESASPWMHRWSTTDGTMARVRPGGDNEGPWVAITWPESLGRIQTFHPTARAAQAACDARLIEAGVRLCGEVVRDG